jgi:hypothetical protein
MLSETNFIICATEIETSKQLLFKMEARRKSQT